MHLGTLLPADADLTGKFLLAALNLEKQKKWVAKCGLKGLAPYTVQDGTQFYKLLTGIQIQDDCLSREKHGLRTIACAVPVLNAQVKAIAALNCMAQTQRITEE